MKSARDAGPLGLQNYRTSSSAARVIDPHASPPIRQSVKPRERRTKCASGRTSSDYRLPSWGRTLVDYTSQFVNAPVSGATPGATTRFVSQLHTLFFSSRHDGGYLNGRPVMLKGNTGMICSIAILGRQCRGLHEGVPACAWQDWR